MKKDIVIVGAGLWARCCQFFWPARIFGKDLRTAAGYAERKCEAGRSINLALSDRGFLALERLGLAEEIRKIAIPMHGRFIHNLDGHRFSTLWQARAIYQFSFRSELNKKLMDLAEDQNVANLI